MTHYKDVSWSDLGQLFDGPHATPTRTDRGPYFLNISSLSNGRLDLNQSDHVSDDDFAKWTRRVTPLEGDLLFSYETRLGEAALMPRNLSACLGRRMALLRPNRDVVDPRFLLYFYLSPQIQRLIEQHTIHGATVNRISLSTMGAWEFPLPDLSTQRAIAEVLGALDDKIAASTKLIETADRLAGALTRRALDHSDTSPLTALATLTMGSSPTGSSYNEVGQGTVFYQGIRDFGIRYPENRIWTTSPVRMAERRDTLLSVRAPVGRLNLANEETCIGRGLASLRSLNGTPFTLFHVLKDSPRIWAPFEAEGTVFGSINKKQLESLEIPNIRMQLGGQLESELAVLEATIENAIVETSSLTAIRDALLPPLMSAELRFKDAEDVVSVVI